MPTTAVGPFLLVDPPTPQDEALVRATIDAIEVPSWDGVTASPEFRQDSDRAVVVEWVEAMVPNTATGLYYSGTNRIVLEAGNAGVGFVFAHEVGHMIDDLVLTDEAREQLSALMHADANPDPKFGHDGTELVPHSEEWVNGAHYGARINEAFADVFVAAYAPRVWAGDVGGGYQRHRRFVHYVEPANLPKVRAVIDPLLDPPAPTAPAKPAPEEDAPMFRDVGRKHPHRRAIERAVRLGLIDPVRPRYFRPRRRVSRGQLAEALVATYDKARKAR